MPIIRADSKLIFFAHVPKCGGSAVQTYLNNRFGPLAFEDRRFLSVPERKRWSKTSPQHVDVETLNRMFRRLLRPQLCDRAPSGGAGGQRLSLPA